MWKIIAIALLVAGCASQPVFLEKNGHRVQCGPYSTTGWSRSLSAPQFEAQCVRDFQIQGYHRVP